MIKKLKSTRDIYRELGDLTKLVIRITLITSFCILLAAVLCYTATYSDLHYRLLLLTDDLLIISRSVPFIGFVGTLIVHRMERK